MRSVVNLLAAACALGMVAAAHPVTAATAPSPYPPLNYRAMDKLGWKLCCQAWTFREMTLFETIDTIKKLGIRYIELYPGQRFSPEQNVPFDHNSPQAMVDALIKKLKAEHITAMNYGVVGLGTNEAEDKKVFEFAKKLGLKTIVSEPDAAAIPMLDKLCREYHMTIAIHDHPKPDYYWSPDVVLHTIAGASDRIGACADTGHWYRSGLDPLECLKQLKGHIISLHFKDLSANKMDAPWGTGVCDTAGMLNEMKAQGFKGVFSIEYESTSGAELVSNVEKCCQYFSAECTKLAAGKPA